LTKPFFKPEDFNKIMEPFYGSRVACTEIAKIANALLQERGVRVFGDQDNLGFLNYSTHRTMENTHQALLVCIEPLTKAECKHEPVIWSSRTTECIHCGVKMKATWSAE
jgi:hypothetical protein